MYTLTKDGVVMQLQSEIQVAAFLKSGWKEVSRTTPQEVVLPDPPVVNDAAAEASVAKKKRYTRKTK